MMNNPFEVLDKRLSSIERALLDLTMAPSLQENHINDQWFSIEELCKYLPGNPSKSTIYTKVSKRLIPHKKFGKRLAFLKSEIDDWLMSQGQRTVADIESEAIASVRK